ncbi:MAG: ATP synthase F1 subunit epsilon [Rhodospirillales bacterium]|nr:ATP synthase F1 subunit epsilon [Rhodospirillales bacterium]
MSLALEIVSPERLLLARDVDMVVIPGTEGDLGILPGHSKLVTSLRGGLVDIYESGKITDRFFVTGGFAEVTESRCSVLADEIIRQADINVTAAQAKLAEAKAAFEAVDLNDADAYRETSDKLISAQAMVDSAAASPAQADKV